MILTNLFGKAQPETISQQIEGLKMIENGARELWAACTLAESAVADQTKLVQRMDLEPSEYSDAAIDDAQKQLRALKRAAGIARKEAQKYADGPAANIAQRLRDAAQQRFEQENRLGRERLFAELRRYLALGEQMKQIESQFDSLTDAAGFGRCKPPALFVRPVMGEPIPWDRVLRGIARINPELLPADHPARIYTERMGNTPVEV